MPRQYESMRDKFAQSMDYDDAQAKAARTYNSKHPDAPVGRSHVSAHERWNRGEMSYGQYQDSKRKRGKHK